MTKPIELKLYRITAKYSMQACIVEVSKEVAIEAYMAPIDCPVELEWIKDHGLTVEEYEITQGMWITGGESYSVWVDSNWSFCSN